jgi:EpsI family protein
VNKSFDIRFWLVAILFVVTAALLHARSDRDNAPSNESLDQVPRIIFGRNGHDLRIDPDVLEVLGPGQYLERVYPDPQGSPPIDLFIGYFPSQRTGNLIHTPKHCLPAAGWSFSSSNYTSVLATDGKRYNVGEYVIVRGAARDFVIYWYHAHGRSVADEYRARFYMVADAIRSNRTDGGLIRVITPIGPNEEVASARARATAFVAELAPQLHRYIPD